MIMHDVDVHEANRVRGCSPHTTVFAPRAAEPHQSDAGDKRTHLNIRIDSNVLV